MLIISVVSKPQRLVALDSIVRRLSRGSEIENAGERMHDYMMDYDKDKVDDMVLALLFLTLHDQGRAWKGHDWDALGRLHTKGMILDPVGKAKSVVLTEQGEKRCEELFRKHFGSSE
jgi:hypothetical protein